MAWMGRRLADFEPLWPAEQRVVDEMGSGAFVVISEALPPKDAPKDVRLRASFVRYLALGGCEACRPPEKGVKIVGAFVYGNGPDGLETRGLDLEGCTLAGDPLFLMCRFPESVLLRGARLGSLYLNNSVLMAGLSGDRVEARGSIVLGGIEATSEVRLPGARLGGNLDCSGATFRAEKDAEGNPSSALLADGLEASGGMFLRGVTAIGEVRLPEVRLGRNLDCDGATFRAEKDANGYPSAALAADGIEVKGDVTLRGVDAVGEIHMLGARLGRNLDCDGTTFRGLKDAEGNKGPALAADGIEVKGDVSLRRIEASGEIRLLSARLGGNLSCAGARLRAEKGLNGELGYALSAEGLEAKGVFFLRHGAKIDGVLSLAGAEVGALNDDAGSWPRTGCLFLDRFQYGAITSGPVDAASRLDWLGRQLPMRKGADFSPQAYVHCAKVLREMGHEEDARAILIEKDRLQRAARLARAPLQRRAVLRAWDAVLRHTIRYGREPLRAAGWLAGVLLLGTIVFFAAHEAGALKPGNPVVLRSAEWVDCTSGAQQGTQLACFLATEAGRSYPAFNALVYSADTLLPIVDLEMQRFWLPDERTPRGAFTRVYLWLQIAAGWALSLLAVAGFSGLVKSD